MTLSLQQADWFIMGSAQYQRMYSGLHWKG